MGGYVRRRRVLAKAKIQPREDVRDDLVIVGQVGREEIDPVARVELDLWRSGNSGGGPSSAPLGLVGNCSYTFGVSSGFQLRSGWKKTSWNKDFGGRAEGAEDSAMGVVADTV